MSLIRIDSNLCLRDGICSTVCPVKLFQPDGAGLPQVSDKADRNCIDCGHCLAACPAAAIDHERIPLSETLPIDSDLKLPLPALTQLIKGRRSIRSFKADPVPRELVERAIDSARWAPSAVNRQPVHWLVIREREEVGRLAGLIIDFLSGSQEMGPRYGGMVRQWERGEDPVLRGAPHLVVLHAPQEWSWSAVDCVIALTQFELAAVADGIGTCWAGFMMRAANGHPPLREALRLPEGHAVYGAMMFGFPAVAYHRIPQRQPARVEWR